MNIRGLDLIPVLCSAHHDDSTQLMCLIVYQQKCYTKLQAQRVH